MKDFKFLKHSAYQRITHDQTITRMGDLSQENIHSIIRSVISDENVCVRGGNLVNPSGWAFDLEAGGFWIQKKDATSVYAVSQELIRNLSVDASEANDRYDLVEGRYAEVEANPVSVDIIDNNTGAITQDTKYTDKVVSLEVQVKKGTAGAGVSPDLTGEVAGTVVGTVDLTSPINLTNKYNLTIDIDMSGTPVTINCRGADPVNTTLAEIIALINAGGFGVIASNDGSNHLKLTSLTVGTDSYVSLYPPAEKDALTVLLGLIEDPLYRYHYRGGAGWFKIGEVRVTGLSANLIADDLRDVDRRGEWTKDNTTIERMHDLRNAVSDESAVRLYNQSIVGGLADKDCVYWNVANARWEKASSVNRPLGVITDVAQLEVTLFGHKAGLSGLTAGDVYMDYSGDFTTEVTKWLIGRAISTTELLIDIDMSSPEMYDIVIKTQSDWDNTFGTGSEVGSGTTAFGLAYTKFGLTVYVYVPAGMSIFIKGNPSDGATTHYYYASGTLIKNYTVNTLIVLSNGSVVRGDGKDHCFIKKIGVAGNGFAMDQTTAPFSLASSTSSNSFTVADSSVFKVGEYVMHMRSLLGGVNRFYKVISIPNPTTVVVNRSIPGAGGYNLYPCFNHHITLDGFTWDSNGGAGLTLHHCADSVFNIRMMRSGGDGITGTRILLAGNYRNTSGHIRVDEVLMAGANGIMYVDHITANKIAECQGAGILESDFANIAEITVCSGSGAYACSNSMFKVISYCYNTAGGGISGGTNNEIDVIRSCYASIFGGGVSGTTNSIIHLIDGCYVTSTSGNAFGGGVYGGSGLHIDRITGCSATTTFVTGLAQGGAGHSSNYGTFNEVDSCSASNPTTGANGIAGGFYQCNYGSFGGIVGATHSSTTIQGAGFTNCIQSSFIGTYFGARSGAPLRVTVGCTQCVWSVITDQLTVTFQGSGTIAW